MDRAGSRERKGFQMSQETIERLQARVNQLEQKVSQLEKEIQATDKASSDATQTAAGRVYRSALDKWRKNREGGLIQTSYKGAYRTFLIRSKL